MIAEESVYKIGSLTRVHGLKGELSLSFTDDVWDRAEAEYLVLRVDGILVPFFLDEYRFRSDSVALLKFLDIDSADEAQPYVGCDVYFPHSLTPEEDPEDLRWSHFTGFQVFLAGQTLPYGVIVSVDESTSNVLFYINTYEAGADADSPAASVTGADAESPAASVTGLRLSSEEVIIPAVEQFIVDVDHQERRLTMELPDGLLDLN